MASLRDVNYSNRLCLKAILLDDSKSFNQKMLREDGRWTTRIEAVKEIVPSILDKLHQDHPCTLVSIWKFSVRAQRVLIPTLPALAMITPIINAIKAEGESTNFADVLEKSLGDYIEFSGILAKDRQVLLITDGTDNHDRDRVPDIVERYTAFGVKINTIVIGNQTDSRVNGFRLQKISKETGGKSIWVNDSEVLLRKAIEDAFNVTTTSTSKSSTHSNGSNGRVTKVSGDQNFKRAAFKPAQPTKSTNNRQPSNLFTW